MEKLEKHIKEKLGARKITPSSQAWDKISGQIGPMEHSNTKRSYWFAVAAGFVGILLTSIFFFKSENRIENTIQTGEQQNTNTNIVQPKDELVGTKSMDAHIPEEIEKEQFTQNESTGHARFLESSEKQMASKSPIRDEFIHESDALIAEKVSEIVAQVALLESVNTEVSDAEVDSLLRSAQRQILTEKLFKDNGTVDAMALLTEVEDELDESFRNQIFEALKDGYFKLRTAVADRNN